MIETILLILAATITYLVIGLNVAMYWRQRIDRRMGPYGLDGLEALIGRVLLFWPIAVLAGLIIMVPTWIGRLVIWLDASGES